MDIQGLEGDILQQMEDSHLQVDYFFVNIHDDPGACELFKYGIYDRCKKILDKKSVEYLYDDRHNGGFGDGLIVAHHKIAW